MSSPIWQGRSAFQHFAKAASEGATPAGLSLLSGLPLITNSRSGCLWGGSTRDVGRPCACSLKGKSKFWAHIKAGACLVGTFCFKRCDWTLWFPPCCLHKRSLNLLLYASLSGPLFFTKAASAPVEFALFTTKCSVSWSIPGKISVRLSVLAHSLYYWWKWILHVLASHFRFLALHHISKGLSYCA